MASISKIKSIIIIFLVLPYNIHTLWAQDISEKRNTVRILTFNILHGATTKGDFNLDIIAQVIIDADPDLVALQEVDYRTNRVQKYDLATELGWRAKMAPIFARAMDYDGGEYGEGILLS